MRGASSSRRKRNQIPWIATLKHRLSRIKFNRRQSFLLGSILLYITTWITLRALPTPSLVIATIWHDDLVYGPSFKDLYKWEKELPQHNLSLPFPEGKTGRYVKFSNQIYGLGWNNVLNEILLSTHLAYESKRAYVFQDYYWKTSYYPWKLPIFTRHPRTPLNALISGPTAGGPWDEGDAAPRSISANWFDVVCPRKERRIISTREVKPALGDASGDVVFATWKKLLLEAPERCIEIVPVPRKVDNYPQIFDLWMISSARVLPLWESFSKSATSRLLATSSLVNAAVYGNEHRFNPRGPKPDHPITRVVYDRVMALHIRRGDYENACLGLAQWNATFYSWNLLHFLPDLFVPPSGGSWGKNTPENTAKYLEHCLPDVDAIVKKVQDAREGYVAGRVDRTLDVLFLLTNAKMKWLKPLMDKLKEDGWSTIVTTKDLKLSQEQLAVGMAVDMDIARRAAVFIGNGWSSFTNNIVHRRLVDGKEPMTNRFW